MVTHQSVKDAIVRPIAFWCGMMLLFGIFAMSSRFRDPVHFSFDRRPHALLVWILDAGIGLARLRPRAMVRSTFHHWYAVTLAIPAYAVGVTCPSFVSPCSDSLGGEVAHLLLRVPEFCMIALVSIALQEGIPKCVRWFGMTRK